MPRLIDGGPDLPDALICRQERGETVFFCGSGISVPTGLPTFKGLVERLYASLDVDRTAREAELIEQGQFEEALGCLEPRLVEGKMRSEVARLVSVPPKPGSLALHRALLQVSRHNSSVRIVTTNYDDNFARAAEDGALRFHAGKERPDLKTWNSVFHLHGRVPADGSARSRLVLTDADFGEAYLGSDPWAAKFVSDLMESFRVVFVGYSMGDVVVRFLTRGMKSAGSARPIYAFVGHRNDAQRDKRSSEWAQYGITPLLYDSRNDHRLLADTVREWVTLASDPLTYRVQVALSGLAREPDREVHEASPDRVAWALSDAASIWPAFKRVQNTPVPGPYAAAWLQVFADHGLLGPMFPDASEPRRQAGSKAQAVAFWIEIHAHAPEVLGWMVRRRGYLHDDLRRRLWDRLQSTETGTPAIPPRLARLWALLLVEPTESGVFSWRLGEVLDSLSRHRASEAADDLLLTVLRPRLGVFPGPDLHRSTLADRDAAPDEIALRNCAHTEVVLGCRDHSWRKNVLSDIPPARHQEFLKRHAVTLTEYLKLAFALHERSDRYDARFVHSDLLRALDEDGAPERTIRSAVESGRVRRRRRIWTYERVGTWTILVDWAVDSYRALPQRGNERRDLLRSWIAAGNPVFLRLALEAVAEDEAADFELVRPILPELLWDGRFAGQVLPILRQAGKRASPEFRRELVDAVQKEAPTSSEQEGPGLDQVASRIAALSDGGLALENPAARILAGYQERRRAAVSVQEPGPLGGRIHEVAAALETGSVSGEMFKELARRRLAGALLALWALNARGVRPTTLWESALDLARERILKEPQRVRQLVRLSELLLRLPDDLFHEIQFGVSRLLNDTAGFWSQQAENAFWRLWRRGWEHRSQDSGTLSPVDALTHAMNTTAGNYATAALKRIGKGRKRGESIPAEHLSTLDLIVQDSSGSAGLVMLVFHLHWLHEHATEWTGRVLLPRLRWEDASLSEDRERETRALWETLAFHGAKLGVLMPVLGPDLWMAVERHKDLHWGESLVRFFVRASSSGALDGMDEEVCRRTARAVIRDSPIQVAVAFRELLDQDESRRGQTWREMVRPWLDHYWPKEKALNTAGSSAAIVEFVTGTGDGFPDAVEWANGYVLPLDDQQIGTIWHNKSAWQSYPRAAIGLLHLVVGTDRIDPWARAPLDEMLKSMREADSTISADPRFRELEQRAAN